MNFLIKAKGQFLILSGEFDEKYKDGGSHHFEAWTSNEANALVFPTKAQAEKCKTPLTEKREIIEC